MPRDEGDKKPRSIAARPFAFERELGELTERLTMVPPRATVKGMFINTFLEALDGVRYPRPTRDRFFAFRDYPLTRYMALMLETVPEAWPSDSPSQSLRRMGQSAFHSLASSMAGRVLFAVAGGDWESLLSLSSRAYELSLSHAKVTVRDMRDQSAVVEMRQVWNFADSYQVGVMEAGLQACGKQGSVRVEKLGRPCDVNLHIEWE
jgi:uncharacterized protein (TIGR02265 family)